MRICALLSCHNRRKLTVECLRLLTTQVPDIEIYLVDDGCTDGTAHEVQKVSSRLTVILGNGNLYWNRGMCLAWETAVRQSTHDYYLWLNDDTMLKEGGVQELVACAMLNGNRAIISGLIEDPVTGETIYGGSDANKKLLQANGHCQTIHRLNGNAVIVPRDVYLTLGGLDRTFHHDLGDVDYGLRAIAASIPVLTTRKHVGFGNRNVANRIRKPNSTLTGRFKFLYSPLGNPPHINFIFRSRHFGTLNAALYYVYLHFINLLPDQLFTLVITARKQLSGLHRSLHGPSSS